MGLGLSGLSRAEVIGVSNCTCGRINGHPHEPDCVWWEERDREALDKRAAAAPPTDRRVANVPVRKEPPKKFYVRGGRVNVKPVMAPRVPLFHARRDENRLCFWCPYCRRVHVHAVQNGVRVAHCDPGSPLRETGYILKQVRKSEL